MHAARIYLQKLKEDQVKMKVDFTNAFNSIHWDKMCAVEEYIPELHPFVHSVYRSSCFLLWGMKCYSLLRVFSKVTLWGPTYSGLLYIS